MRPRASNLTLIGLLATIAFVLLSVVSGVAAPGSSVTTVSLLILPIVLLLLISVGILTTSGFTKVEILILIWAAIFGALLPLDAMNVLLYRVGDVAIAVNLVGAVVPALVSVKILLSKRLALLEATIGLLMSSYAAYELSTFDPSIGIVVESFLLVPLISALFALLVKGPFPESSSPLAFFYGSLGILFGADVLRLPQVLSESYSNDVVISIGGVGTADAIFMAGIIAIAMDVILEIYQEEQSTSEVLEQRSRARKPF